MKDIIHRGKTKGAPRHSLFAVAGVVFLIVGALLLIIKAFSAEYVDAEGFLHESFFLLPCGFACIFAGIILEIVAGIQALIHRSKKAKEKHTHED